MANRKRTNHDRKNTTQKTKDRTTRTPLKMGVNLVPAPLVTPVVLL